MNQLLLKAGVFLRISFEEMEKKMWVIIALNFKCSGEVGKNE
jgi:hypothetical protein